MMCHDDATVKLPRNYIPSVPVRSLLERGSFLFITARIIYLLPPRGKGRGKGQGWGERNYLQTRVDFWLLITHASAASRPCRGCTEVDVA
jgi:hypothetical protein